MVHMKTMVIDDTFRLLAVTIFIFVSQNWEHRSICGNRFDKDAAARGFVGFMQPQFDNAVYILPEKIARN